MDNMRFERAQDDDFKAAEPDSLMASVSQSQLGRTLAVSSVLHLVVILLLSLGNIGLCLTYRTVSPRRAITLRDEAAKAEQEAKRKAEKAEKREKALQAEAAAAAKRKAAAPAAPAQKADRTVPKVIRETTEVLDQRPESSSLDSIDDLLEE